MVNLTASDVSLLFSVTAKGRQTGLPGLHQPHNNDFAPSTQLTPARSVVQMFVLQSKKARGPCHAALHSGRAALLPCASRSLAIFSRKN